MQGSTKAPKLYQCPECGFRYTDEETANKCQAWCKQYKSCNLEIVKLAVENRKQASQSSS